jgi:hypothetical protein
VRGDHGGLQQEEAFLRICEVDTGDAFAFDLCGEDLVAAAFGDPLVIVSGVEGVRGEFEAALAFDAAMAGGGVAAALGEDAENFAAEGDGLEGGGSFDFDCGFGFAAGDGGCEREVAIG